MNNLLLLERQVDLLFVDFTLNDGFEDVVASNSNSNSRVRVMERLMRKALAKPHTPAVVLMQMGCTGVVGLSMYLIICHAVLCCLMQTNVEVCLSQHHAAALFWQPVVTPSWPGARRLLSGMV